MLSWIRYASNWIKCNFDTDKRFVLGSPKADLYDFQEKP